MSQKKTDEELLAKIQSGNEVAFRILYDKYYPILIYTAYNTFPDEHKAKDFAQEVFIDTWRKRADLKIHTSIGAFLKRAVVNKAIDYIRSQRLDFGKTIEQPIHLNQIELNDDSETLKTLIHKTIETLPKRCRMIFLMSRFEGLSHREIAEILDISQKTIENQITKALKV